MITLIRPDCDQKWSDLWSNMDREWFKFEVLQDYSSEDRGESLTAWMNGDTERSIQLLSTGDLGWFYECRKKVDKGARLIRVHLVDYPLSRYMEWEIEAYKVRNIGIGKEEVYLLERSVANTLTVPDGDVMVFDHQAVVTNEYDRNGGLIHESFYDSSDDMSSFFALQKAIMAMPLQRLSASTSS